MKTILLKLLGLYMKYISPLFASSCRFYPTCSAYAYQAINEHGLLRGSRLALNRLLRCHPWHPGGSDPVPAKKQGL